MPLISLQGTKLNPLEQELNILHLSTAMTWRGGEQQVAYLMDELRKKGVHQFVFCPKGTVLETNSRKQGFDLFAFKKSFNLNPFTALQIKRICIERGITHLHAHDSPAHTFAVMAAAIFGLNIPIIVHRRVDFPISKNWFSRWKYNHPAVRHIICVSGFIKRLILSEINAKDKLRVIHSGIDLSRFGKGKNQIKSHRLRSEFGIPRNHFLVANIAAIAPHKDYFTFVKAAEKLIMEGFPASFLAIGGDGGEMETVQQFIQEKGLGDQIKLIGFRNDIDEVLPEIDLLLFTSKTEGLGTSLLDAFAAGVPVVATDGGGIPEIVENGMTGLLCPVGDSKKLARAVHKLLTDSVLRTKIIQAANKQVQAFSKEKMASEILEIYCQTWIGA